MHRLQTWVASATELKRELTEYFYHNEERGYLNLVGHSDQKKGWASRICAQVRNCQDLDPQSFLDVGCGEGTLTKGIIEGLDVRETVALDPSDVMLKRAKRSFASSDSSEGIRFLQGQLDNGKTLADCVGDERFDLVLCSYIFFWVDEWEVAIEQIMGALNSGGLASLVMLSSRREKDLYGLRSRLFHLAHGVDEFKFEEVTQMEQVLRAKGIRYEIEDAVSTITLPGEWLDAIRAEAPLEQGGMCGEAQNMAHLVEFLSRAPWHWLSLKQRTQVLDTISEFRDGSKLSILLPEASLSFRARL